MVSDEKYKGVQNIFTTFFENYILIFPLTASCDSGLKTLFEIRDIGILKFLSRITNCYLKIFYERNIFSKSQVTIYSLLCVKSSI